MKRIIAKTIIGVVWTLLAIAVFGLIAMFAVMFFIDVRAAAVVIGGMIGAIAAFMVPSAIILWVITKVEGWVEAHAK